MRFPGWVLPAGCIALCANGALLGTAVFLSHEEIEQKQDISAPIGVNMFEMAPDEPEQDQQVAEPEKPKEEPQPDLGPDLFEAEFAPELAAMGGAGDAVAINLGGATQGMSKEKFVFETYELDQAPRAVVKTPPVYPYKAREQHVEGVVQVKILVREDGSVGEVLILDSRPKDVFDDAVLASVPRWRFEPGKVGGKAVTSVAGASLQIELMMKTSILFIALVCLALVFVSPALAADAKAPAEKPIDTLETLPRDAKLALFEAQTLLEKGESEKAVEQLGKYVRAHEKKDDRFLVRYQYASMLVQVDKREEALKEYERVTQLEPRYDAGWMGLGETAYGLGQYARAADALMKGYELSAEKRPELLYYAAAARLLAGQAAEALPLLDELTSGKHGAPKFEWYRGYVSGCLQAEDKDRGQLAVNSMLEKFPNNPDAWFLAFQYYASVSNYRQAAVSLTIVSYLRPLTRQEQIQLGDLYASVDAPAAAAEHYASATADSASAGEIERVASAYLASYQAEQALKVLDRGLKEKPTFRLWSLLGDLQVMEKHFDEAYRAFIECTKLSPEEPRPYLMLGYCAIELEDPTLALSHLNKIADNEEYSDRVKMLVQRAEIMQAAPTPEPTDSSQSSSDATSLSGK